MGGLGSSHQILRGSSGGGRDRQRRHTRPLELREKVEWLHYDAREAHTANAELVSVAKPAA